MAILAHTHPKGGPLVVNLTGSITRPLERDRAQWRAALAEHINYQYLQLWTIDVSTWLGHAASEARASLALPLTASSRRDASTPKTLKRGPQLHWFAEQVTTSGPLGR